MDQNLEVSQDTACPANGKTKSEDRRNKIRDRS